MFSFYPEHLFFHSVLTTHDRSAICLEAYSAVILGVFSKTQLFALGVINNDSFPAPVSVCSQV